MQVRLRRQLAVAADVYFVMGFFEADLRVALALPVGFASEAWASSSGGS